MAPFALNLGLYVIVSQKERKSETSEMYYLGELPWWSSG